MPRPRIHESDTARKRFWRKNRPTKEQKAALERLYTFWIDNPDHKPSESIIAGRKAREKEKQRNRPFIAIDGEGESRGTGRYYTQKLKSLDGKPIEVEREIKIHYYTMLSSSEGHTIENWKFGLSTQACFEFLHQYAGKGILVGFFTSYDINMMLKDMDYESLIELYEKGATWWNGWFVEWFAGKNFCLSKDGKNVTWFDVFGFFQKSFLKTLVDWKIVQGPKYDKDGVCTYKGDATYLSIESSKLARSSFTKAQRESIKTYNLKECELLVTLMNKLRIAAREAGCEPRRWHGAGAIASTVLKANRIDEHNPEIDPELEKILLSGYYGGRNQVLRQGEFDSGFSHDINSAYPFALRTLPSSIGIWKQDIKPKFDQILANRSTQEKLKWSIWRVKWKLPKDSVLTPFPFRQKTNIYFPCEGEGWYWQPEVITALKLWPKHIKVIEGFYFEPIDKILPFSFIDDLYSKRREFIRDGNDAQLVVKLAINALYGKTAQSIGFQGNRPPFQNYFWSGYTTSVCRAMVLEMASRNPESVISIATDGVLSEEKLTEHNLTKQLGSWSVEPIDNLFVLQPGVYTFTDAEHKSIIKSRGFAHKSVDYDALRALWRKEGATATYNYTETRFLGLGATLRSKLSGWRTWVEQERELNFAPSSGHTSMELAKNNRVYPEKKIASGLSEPYTKKSDWLTDEAKDEMEQ